MREDWVEIKLGDVLKLKNGYAFKSSKYSSEGVPIIRISDINQGVVTAKNAKRIAMNTDYDNYQVKFGDILIAMSGATTGKFGVYKDQQKTYQNQRVGNLKLHNDSLIDKKYIYYLFYSLRQRIEKDAYGGAQPNISGKKIEAIEFKLAPLPEQRAIVSKIEQLFSELDHGIANLQAAKDKLEIYRQAVLKKAFEGELTKEWREQQSDLPTADELLEQIKEERLKHYENQLREWEEAVAKWEANGKQGKKPRKPRKVKELPELSEMELNELDVLPKEWKWVKVDMIQFHNQYSIKAGPFGSSLKKSYYVATGYKVYGQEQVIGGDWRIGNYYIDQLKFEELRSCAIKPKDVLISLVGTVGKVLVLPDEIEPGIINPRLIKITLAKDYYNPYFFKYYFESAYLKSLYSTKSHGATMDIINLGIIQELPFLLLSLNEQYQITQEIESRLSICDNILDNIEDGLEKSEALRHSILKQAFEGKLLSEEELEACKKKADWEPAEQLLERIKTEKEV